MSNAASHSLKFIMHFIELYDISRISCDYLIWSNIVFNKKFYQTFCIDPLLKNYINIVGLGSSYKFKI